MTGSICLRKNKKAGRPGATGLDVTVSVLVAIQARTLDVAAVVTT